MTSMWEILVPTEKRVKTVIPTSSQFDSGKDYLEALDRWQKKNSYTTKYHRVWDQKVREISGGLTVMTPVKGQWVSPDGELFKERMIPVRIICTREQIEQIIDMSMVYYDQLAILAYQVSSDVILKHRAEDQT